MMVHFPLLLVIDDDPTIVHSLQLNLEADGFDVLTATTGAEANGWLQRKLPDLIIVDLLLPDTHGFELCKKIKSYLDVPIIMLTAVGTEDSMVSGIDLYAEDYIVKPFSYRELLARINRVLKRTQHVVPREEVLVVDENLHVNFARHSVQLGSKEVRLTPTESRLLAILARNTNRVVSRDTLMDQVWPDGEGDLNRLWVSIERLRAKIEANPQKPQRIVTERGVGYKLRTLQ